MAAKAAEITTLSQVVAERRLAFYRRMYPGRADVLDRNWRWWYRVSFEDGIAPIAALSSGHMIGHAGVIPVKVRYEDQEALCAWFVDFAVLPEYQGMGLGRKLTGAWMEMCPNPMAYCNENSFRIFERCGWRERFDTVRCALPLTLKVVAQRTGSALVRTGSNLLTPVYGACVGLKFRDAISVSPERLPRDPSVLSRLFEEDAREPISVVRDAEWVQWRLLDSPFVDSYLLFRTVDAFALVRDLNSRGLKRADVIYLSEKPSAESRMALIRSIARWAYESELDLVWMVTCDPRTLGELKWLLPSRQPMRFAWFSGDERQGTAFFSGPLPFQAIDSDIDLSHQVL